MFKFRLGKRIKYSLHCADNKTILKNLKDNSVDAVLTDPPYGLTNKTDVRAILTSWLNDVDYLHTKQGFMGKKWDGCVPGPLFWQECYRVLRPGGYMLVFGGPRTVDILTISLRLANFEIRDVFLFLHGMGFPKGQDLGQSIQKKFLFGAARRPDRELGLSRNRWNGGRDGLAKTGGAIELTFEEAKKWCGWNTQIKPAYEPIVLVQKPLSEKNFAENVLKWGVGALNVDVSRVELAKTGEDKRLGGKGVWSTKNMAKNVYSGGFSGEIVGSSEKGRYPANVQHDGSVEVEEEFDRYGVHKDGKYVGKNRTGKKPNKIYGKSNVDTQDVTFGGKGTISRFFYCAKVSTKERGGSNHPTQKKLKLIRYYASMITPPGGILLDPFMGSNTTGIAAHQLGFNYIGIEQDPEEYKGALKKTKFHIGYIPGLHLT